MVAAKRVHDEVRAGAAVENVAQDVKAVDGQALDEAAEGHDEVVRAAGGDDGVDNHVEVGLLVVVLERLVEELLDDVGELLGQTLAHLRAGVLRRDVAADGDELVERGLVVVGQVPVGGLDELELLFGIINQGAEILLLLFAQGVAEELADLALDVSRGVAEHMLESLVLAV